MSYCIIEAEQLTKIYGKADAQTFALKNASIRIKRGTFVTIIGASGSGKSTMLNLLAGLDRPTPQPNQKLIVRGMSLLGKSENWLAEFRAANVGFILQFFGLLDNLTVLENVVMATYFNEKPIEERNLIAENVLRAVELGDRLHHYPSQLSGGQMQRVAIARAMVNKPEILFADEPTGNLDSKNAIEILELLRNLVKTKGITLILVTHDPAISECSDQIIEIQDGEIVQNKEKSQENSMKLENKE